MSWPAALGTSPAAAIHQHLSAQLREEGGRGSHNEVAELVGEDHGSAWGRYVRGDVEPGAKRVQAWCIAQDLVLECTPTGWRVATPE